MEERDQMTSEPKKMNLNTGQIVLVMSVLLSTSSLESGASVSEANVAIPGNTQLNA